MLARSSQSRHDGQERTLASPSGAWPNDRNPFAANADNHAQQTQLLNKTILLSAPTCPGTEQAIGDDADKGDAKSR
jgi:hypothetical protein